jgi:hypothetical protein
LISNKAINYNKTVNGQILTFNRTKFVALKPDILKAYPVNSFNSNKRIGNTEIDLTFIESSGS